MRVDVLQAVAICCYGNAFLSGATGGRAPELLGCHSTFRGASDLIFERGSGMKNLTGGNLAEGTSPWFRRLQSEGVESLRLCLDRCGLSTSGEEDGWGIMSDGDVGLELWQPVWKSRFARYGESALAKITYSSTRFSRWGLADAADFIDAGTELIDALEEGLELCRLFGLDEISEWLLKCVVYYRSGEVSCPGFPDLLPQSIPNEQRVLSSASVRALLVLSSSAWTEATAADETSAALHPITMRIWKGALRGFEAAAFEIASAA